MRIRNGNLNITEFIIFLLLFLVFNACEKQNDLFDYAQLIGKWEMESEKCKEYFDSELLFDGTYTYEPGSTFLEFRSDGTGATFEKDSLVVSFEWSRSDNTIHIDTDNPGMISSFTIQSLDQQMLIYQVRIFEQLDQEGAEYISICDFTLFRVGDGS